MERGSWITQVAQIITEVLIRGGLQGWSPRRRYDSRSIGGGTWPQAGECGQPLEASKHTETDLPLESPEGAQLLVLAPRTCFRLLKLLPECKIIGVGLSHFVCGNLRTPSHERESSLPTPRTFFSLAYSGCGLIHLLMGQNNPVAFVISGGL